MGGKKAAAEKQREEAEKKSVTPKKKKSLNDEFLKLLSNPSPKYKDFDPEDVSSLTKSWKPKKKGEEEFDSFDSSGLSSHSKSAPSLRNDSFSDSKYAGKVVSKDSLFNQQQLDSSQDEFDEGEENEDEEEIEEENENEEESEEEIEGLYFQDSEEEEELEEESNGKEEKMKKRANAKMDKLFAGLEYDSEEENGDNQEEGSEEEGEGEEEEEEVGEEEGEEEGKQIKSKVLDEADELQRQLEEEEQQEEPSTFKSVKEEENELERALHTRNQTNLYGSLMGLRIHMQNSLHSANRLPKKENLVLFQKDSKVKAKMNEVNHSLMGLMTDLLDLQSLLKEQNEETNQFKRKKRANTSDLESLWNSIQNEEETFKAFEEETVEKWNQRVLLSSGANAGKQFKAINQTVMHQVNTILQDKSRLIARTQQKRSNFHVFGSEEKDDQIEKDEEIFDDGDFYQYLLKEMVENGAKDIDPSIYSQFLKENSRMSKKAKKTNGKKSKGRQIQYETIDKLVGFMAPLALPVNFSEQLERSQELFLNLFGQKQS